MAVHAEENWDDDLDLEGPLLANSTSTQQTSISSRLSIRADSVAADEDWEFDLAPNDESSVNKAITHAKTAGIPIPANVPSSALIGGTIKRLGTKQTRPNVKDDWGDELDFGNAEGGGLKLNITPREPVTAADEEDGFSDWAEGSLGIRTAGTRHAQKHRQSSVSAMSPSMGSCVTAESDEDGLDGLDIPAGPVDFGAALTKRPVLRSREDSLSEDTTIVPVKSTVISPVHQDDFLADMDFTADDVFDLKRKTLNRNIKPSWKPATENQRGPKTQASLVFTEAGSDTRIPRPSPVPRATRLEPVLESATSHSTNLRRPEPANTNIQQLRPKRSSTGLRNQLQPPFKPGSGSYTQPTNSHLQTQTSLSRFAHYNARRESDPARAQSPPLRPRSRLSHAFAPDTPTRQRREVAPPILAREAAAKRTLTKPARRRNFGDGSELDTFDDLPTSAAKESKFTKQPILRPAPKMLRQQPSLTKLAPLRDRMTTPMPPSTPSKSQISRLDKPPHQVSHVPHFARDTAASRIAREQKLGPVRNSRDMPLAHKTNWAAQIAARTPVASPTASRVRRGPQLINPMGMENIRHFQEDAAKKGMRWNAIAGKWEGNEVALINFDAFAPPSPPRPALITNISGTKGVQVSGGMVFDPARMRWFPIGATTHNNPQSPSSCDEDDPFRDIEDLKDDRPQFERSGASGARASVGGSGDWAVSEEFDLGPDFIRRQRDEELVWRSKTGSWFVEGRGSRDESWKWAIRDIAAGVASMKARGLR